MALVTEEMIEVANRAHQKALEECEDLICPSDHLEAAIQAVAPLIVERCAEVADELGRSILAQEEWDPDDAEYNCDAYEEAEYVAASLGSCAGAIRALAKEDQPHET